MQWGDILILEEYVSENDSLNSPYLSKKSSKEVFCNVKSVKRAEYYQAQSLGYKPEKVFIVKIADFEEKYNYVLFNSKEYSILRTYKINSEDIELTCVGKTYE